MLRILVFVLLSMAFAGFLIYHGGLNVVQAQTEAWSTPVNLSNSMAASQPSIVAGPDGTMQVFWVDRFDGLVTRTKTLAGWSEPLPVPVSSTQLINPYIIADNSSWVHAFWSEPNKQEPQFTPLYHSQMVIGGGAWSQPVLIAEDALTFAVVPQAVGGLNLTYLRRAHNSNTPAGIYFKTKQPAGGSWNDSQNVFNSIYYRLLQTGESTISISDDGAGNIFIAWHDPLKRQPYISESKDNGLTWSGERPFGHPQTVPSRPRLTAIPGSTLGIWQSNTGSKCELYQQETPPSALSSLPSLPITTTLEAPSRWSSPQSIFPTLENCPVSDQFYPQPTIDQIYWVWGKGTNSLSLTIWDAEKGEWSVPQPQSFNFEEPETGNAILLGDLHTVISKDQFAVVGADTSSDIWITESLLSTLALSYSSPPPWSQPQLVSEGNQNAESPTLAMDVSGKAHLVWSQPALAGDLGAALFYSYWDSTSGDTDQLTTNTIQLPFSNPDELSRAASLAVDEANSLLHLAWVGGRNSEITVSRVPTDRGNSPNEWFPAQVISNILYATSPKIAVDGNRAIYAIYAVPVNEDRGIYLVKSEDQGQTWTSLGSVFDASGTSVPAVDHPDLAIDLDGTLYASWAETDRVGSGAPRGIYFSFSKDDGKSWSDPIILAGASHDLPRIALSGNQVHLLYSQLVPGGGLVWHRSILKENLTTDEKPKWSPAIQVSAADIVSLPFGVATDGSPSKGTLHLVTSSAKNGSLTYYSWQNGEWSKSEDAQLSKGVHPAQGLQAAASPNGGSLAAAWVISSLAGAELRKNLYFSARTIPTQIVEIQPTPTSIPTLAATIGPTPTIYKPTSTPDLNLTPPPGGSSQAPVILAGVLSLIVISGFFAWRIYSERRK